MGRRQAHPGGQKAEELAAAFLQQLGYTIIERNYNCRQGELDIIAKDGDTLVFVEVKGRSSSSYGSPVLAVNLRKQGKLTATALDYLASRQHYLDLPCRFDVVGVNLTTGKIEHLPHAFITDSIF